MQFNKKNSASRARADSADVAIMLAAPHASDPLKEWGRELCRNGGFTFIQELLNEMGVDVPNDRVERGVERMLNKASAELARQFREGGCQVAVSGSEGCR